ncbi:MAG: mercury(II) reductase [Gemmatimonadota bacterium]
MVQHDLLVIGGGSAAFAAAIRGAELGARVALLERGTIGGTCVNVGCVPSKALIRAAEIAWSRQHHPFEGVPRDDGRIDVGRLVRQKRELVERLRQTKYGDVLAAYPAIEYVEGEARFRDPESVEIRLNGGGGRELPAERVVLAVGAKPWAPPIPGLDRVPYWTSTEALEVDDLPERLIVVGGSAVGTELAQLYARLGTRVTVLEALPTLVPNEDADLGRELANCLADEGIEIHVGTEVRSVARAGVEIRVRAGTGGGEREFTGDRLLVATGRRPDLGALDLEAAGVETDDRGFIAVDDRLQTSQSHVYGAGDGAGLPQFVYVAAKAGGLAAENALGNGERSLDLSAVPAVTFTDPQVASVGRTEAEARASGADIVVQRLPLEHVPRALVNRDTRGFVKIVAHETDGRILGVHVLSPQAGEVIQTGVLAVKLGLTIEDVADTFFRYLTEVDGLRCAAQTFSRQVEQLSCCAG